MTEIILKGIPAASGIAEGPSFILDKQEFIIPPRAVMEKEVPIEIARFEEALIKTREEILAIQKKISSDALSQHAQIFDAHLLVLEDRTLIEEVIKRIKTEKLSAEYIFSEVLKKYVKIFGFLFHRRVIRLLQALLYCATSVLAIFLLVKVNIEGSL